MTCCNKSWTYEEIKNEALKCHSRSNFESNNKLAYDAARRRGVLEDVCSHMEPQYTYWTEETLHKEALKYNTRSQFKLNNASAYATSLRRGILYSVCGHMDSVNIMWSDKSVAGECLKYSTRAELQQKCPSAYSYARRNNILDEVCKHMQPSQTSWSTEMLCEEALKYSTRKDFERNNCSAYTTARVRGILNDICSHMIRGKHGFNCEKVGYFYIVVFGNYVGFGITNYPRSRLQRHKKTLSRVNQQLTVHKIIRFQEGGVALSLEKYIKELAPIMDAGIEGFRTEAVSSEDIDVLLGTVSEFLVGVKGDYEEIEQSSLD